jgi:hypothetical protein
MAMKDKLQVGGGNPPPKQNSVPLKPVPKPKPEPK